jgi:hypothetical protein
LNDLGPNNPYKTWVVETSRKWRIRAAKAVLETWADRILSLRAWSKRRGKPWSEVEVWDALQDMIALAEEDDAHGTEPTSTGYSPR